MAENSKIEWTDHTANLWWGCEPVHSGCDNCYARTIARSKGKAEAWNGARFATVGVWKDLPKWDAAARAAGRVDRVFSSSMMDIFEKSLPALTWQGETMPGVETGHLRDRYLREIVPATPNLLHLLLTKRPSNILKMVPPEWLERWPANVMTGTSPVDQPTADTLLPQLLRVPGRHFISVEPMLGPISLTGEGFIPADDEGPNRVGYMVGPDDGRSGLHPTRAVALQCSGLHWVICGGESGHGARPINPDWVRSLRDQCAAAGVPFLMKQWGEWAPIEMHPTMPGHGRMKEVRQFIDTTRAGHQQAGPSVIHVGKKPAGRVLDGRTHDDFPP